MKLADIDAVFSASSALPMAPLSVAEYLGLSPRYVDGTQVGGSALCFTRQSRAHRARGGSV
jgi:hypothetical protein